MWRDSLFFALLYNPAARRNHLNLDSVQSNCKKRQAGYLLFA